VKSILCVVLLCFSPVAVGCESDANESQEGRSAAASAASPTTTAAGEATERPPGGTPPDELQGTWLTDLGGGPARLYIRGDRYIVSAGGSAQGDVAVDGSVIAFFNANGASCPPDPADDVGRYRWKISDGKLRLKQLGDDPCAGRIAIMTNGPFERTG
jgi:hypothetical protein